jgi:hypothetical protein
MGFALKKFMAFKCHRCSGWSEGGRYRVWSEESGVMFLEMIVCSPCYWTARKLGMFTEKIRNPDTLKGRFDLPSFVPHIPRNRPIHGHRGRGTTK